MGWRLSEQVFVVNFVYVILVNVEVVDIKHRVAKDAVSAGEQELAEFKTLGPEVFPLFSSLPSTPDLAFEARTLRYCVRRVILDECQETSAPPFRCGAGAPKCPRKLVAMRT